MSFVSSYGFSCYGRHFPLSVEQQPSLGFTMYPSMYKTKAFEVTLLLLTLYFDIIILFATQLMLKLWTVCFSFTGTRFKRYSVLLMNDGYQINICVVR